eukprot:UN05500
MAALEVQKIMKYHQLTTEKIDTIKQKNVGSTTLFSDDPFCKWVDDINTASQFFKEHRFSNTASVLKKLKQIAGEALVKLQKHLTDILKDFDDKDNLKKLFDHSHGGSSFLKPDNIRKRSKSAKSESIDTNMINDR